MGIVTGDGGDVTLGSTALQVIEWSADIEATEIDITNVASGGWAETTLGNKKMSGSAKAQWDATINTGAPPYPIVIPQAVADAEFQIGGDAGLLTADIVITKMSLTNASDKAVEYSIDFTSSGAVAYTAPT